MAITTWPIANTADAVSSGRNAKTVGLAMYQRDMVVRQSGMTVKVSGNTGNASYTTVDTFTIQTPTFAVSGMILRLFVHLVDTGGGTSKFRIQDNASATNGTDSATVTTDDWVESELTWGAWTGERLINIQALVAGGSSDAAVDSLSGGMNLRWRDN